MSSDKCRALEPGLPWWHPAPTQASHQCPLLSRRLLGGPALLLWGANPALPVLSPALWTFLWFVGFCFLTNQWVATNPQDVLVGADSARAAITFSFFSIFSWVGGPSGQGLVSLGKVGGLW